MADTTFVNGEGTIDANWLNDVNEAVYHADPPVVLTKIIEIGFWDMDTLNEVTVAHGLDEDKIRSVSVVIDSGGILGQYPLNYINDTATMLLNGGLGNFITGDITLVRRDGGFFDSTWFANATINRGWITIQYIA